MDTSIKLRGEGGEHWLGSVLSKLSERGCSILVAGEMTLPTAWLVSRRFFGHPEEPRKRILVRLRETKSLENWFAGAITPDDAGVRIVDCIDPTRAEAGFEDFRWKSRFDPAEIPALTRRQGIEDCIDEVEAITAEASPLAPSQLRVGVYRLDGLDGPDEMIDAVSAINSTVTGNQGMVHYHLHRPPETETAQTLLNHVDAMVTTRNKVPNTPPEHQWRVPEYGNSDWLPLGRFE